MATDSVPLTAFSVEGRGQFECMVTHGIWTGRCPEHFPKGDGLPKDKILQIFGPEKASSEIGREKI
ncbi:Protein of unknown function [Cotesia congregata]|uniref:Uncharacterized protein n=1 Tax=Cotesia congregata TaxID=51543 RepID=A0A8J2HQ06_COTCN|nr:Protein of unknown function [Cotesia congregata]